MYVYLYIQAMRVDEIKREEEVLGIRVSIPLSDDQCIKDFIYNLLEKHEERLFENNCS